ncbi:MAG: ketoacyl-ACP synthase III [Candidatus Omnitrophica bacterium]|nr:ketoacyl-ACP synthase III [Candidatus Omnitrophota bacterium]MDD3274218.1 ketoacyl-ACP synthase III [Candidatus Omnitrophota bacterium]MDD5077879.1 ketoacyl-ACP synthase III [Candidatus Omnitrophota bacterium]MDD5725268.1 ketoacyl-ACP synthase III [Candidatus Omnitrophota bacterium]
MKKVGIIGLGECLPEKILSNADLEKMVETSDEWITTRTGIKQRRIASENEAVSDLAIKAAREALKDAGLSAADLDLIIVATITGDMPMPSTASIVQNALSAKKAAAFDISAACAGFVYGLSIGYQFIVNGSYKNVLIIGAEKLSAFTDWKDRNTCVLFGDGAGACILSEVKSGGIASIYLGCDGSNLNLLNLPAGGSRMPASEETVRNRMHYIKMQGNELFKIAVRTMTEAAQVALEQAGITFKDVDLIVPHQANSRIIMAVAKRLGISEDKIYLNIEKYGNMSSASTITGLVEAVKEGRVKKGDTVLLDCFGGGLVWGACVINL